MMCAIRHLDFIESYCSNKRNLKKYQFLVVYIVVNVLLKKNQFLVVYIVVNVLLFLLIRLDGDEYKRLASR